MDLDKILCVISARGGSKGVPNKNIRLLNGEPIISIAIKKAKSIFERVFVSTDSKKIAEIAKESGAEIPFIRPKKLSLSETGKFQVWQHALNFCEINNKTLYDYYLDIDCTNPLLDKEDIKGIINFFENLENTGSNPDAAFTVCEARRNPYFNIVEEDKEGILNISKKIKGTNIVYRQSAPTVFDHVAGAYILSAKYLKSSQNLLDGRVFGYLISSIKGFDIDTELDFKIIEFLSKSNLEY